MSVYLIEVADTKQGVMYPTIVGPFVNEEDAGEFAEEMHMGYSAQDGEGGYSAAHIISDASCDYTPERYRKIYRELDEDEFLGEATGTMVK